MSEDGHGLPAKESVKRWLVTTNHKDIGILYIITSLFFLVLGGVMALLIRTQLWTPGGTILGGFGYNQTVSSHGLLMVFWFISPFAFGLANYIVPLQIGAEDLAFPRLNSLSYWLYLVSGVLFGVSFFQGMTFPGGWTMYAPLNVPAFIPGEALGATTAVLALVLFVASVTVSSVNFLTTMYRMRAEDFRMRDLPMFSLSIVLTVWMMLFAFAALLAALLILSSDHLLGTTYFTFETQGGGSLLWTHLFWFFGHPEVYIVFFPALGIMAECFQTFSGRRLAGRKWFILSMVLVALQSFLVWMHHMFLTGINLEIKTVFMVTTIGISLPFDLMMFSLIYTLIKGRIRYTTPFLFTLGSVVLFIVGGITGVFLGAVVLDLQFRGTYWVVAHFHYVMVGGVTALIGGLYYWFPKITGRMYDEFLGKVNFALYFVGFNLLYFPMFVAWETPRRVFEYNQAFVPWHRMATVGGFVLGASFLVLFYNLFKSLFAGETVDDNPWEYASSAEWAVPSPPPLGNFPGLPSYAGGKLSFLSSESKPELAAADGGVNADMIEVHEDLDGEDEHADHASIWPLYTSIGAFATFLGLSGVSFPATPALSLGGFALPYSWALIAVGPLAGGVLAGLWLRRGGKKLTAGDHTAGVATLVVFGAFGVEIGTPYLGLTVVGATLGLLSLVAFAGEHFEAPEPPVAERWPFEEVEKTKLGMWIFLGSDIVLFGAFIGSYLFVRVAEGWRSWHELVPEAHVPLPGLINTYLLLTSSFAIVLALVAARKHSRRGLLASLGATFVLGAAFLVNKALEWSHLLHVEWHHAGETIHGWWLSTNIASSTFYLTTGLHGAHVAVGLLITAYLFVRAWNGAYLGEEEPVEYFGLYWHFVDIVWLFLFPLFYIV
ncbi:MAG: cbb3-type cytochrome c oxidase subunit I [Salinirussus sp.]